MLLTAGAFTLSGTDTHEPQTVSDDVSDRIEWSQVHTLAQRHGMEPLVIQYLQQTRSDELPPEFEAELQQRMAAIQARNLAFVAELRSLLNEFQNRNISVLVYKGPVIANRAYDSIALRSYTDIDLLVPPQKDEAARALLKEQGYRHQTTNGPVAQAVYRRPTQQPTIDLHTSVIPEFFPFAFEFGELYDRRITVDVGGTAVPTMSVDDACLIHTIHGAKHHWYRIEWVLATALLSQQVTDMERTIAEAEQLGCDRMLLLALILARDLFSAPLPKAIENKLATNSDDAAVVKTASDEIIDWILHEEWAQQNVKRTHIADFKLRSQLLSSRSAKVRFWIRALTKPRSEDIDWVALPNELRPLYRVLRPIRLLWEYRKTLATNTKSSG